MRRPLISSSLAACLLALSAPSFACDPGNVPVCAKPMTADQCKARISAYVDQCQKAAHYQSRTNNVAPYREAINRAEAQSATYVHSIKGGAQAPPPMGTDTHSKRSGSPYGPQPNDQVQGTYAALGDGVVSLLEINDDQQLMMQAYDKAQTSVSASANDEKAGGLSASGAQNLAGATEGLPAFEVFKRPANKDAAIAQQKLEKQIQELADQGAKGDSTADARVVAVRMQQGDFAGAQEPLERAIRRDPKNAKLKSMYARSLWAAGDGEGAKRAAREALELDPDDQLAKIVVGNEKELAAGAERLKKIKVGFGDKEGPGGVSLDDETAQKLEALGPLVGVTATPIQRESAERNLAYSAAGLPALDSAATASQVQSILRTAALRIGSGDLKGPDGALFQISRALMLEPNNVEARVLRAHVSNLPAVHNYTAAILDADAALKLKPQSAAALFEKGYAQLQLGQVGDAVRTIEDGLALEPQNAMGRLYHAMALEKANLIAKAIDEYNAAARLDPALKPVIDEALGRLAGEQLRAAQTASAPAPRNEKSVPLRLILLAALGLAAAGLLLEGGKRVFYKDWKTTVQPSASSSGAFVAGGASEGTLAPGAMLGNNFRIERELARGGLGIVYLATDVTLQRKVAIKQLNRDATKSEDVRRRFVQEAQLAARLRHANLAEIFSAINEDGRLYLVFEFVEGEALSTTLQQRVKLPLAEVKRVARDVASALDYAHSQKVIHRDLKPANVMVTGGRAKIMDFGIAHEARQMTDATQTQAWGTPPYMAPEQELGRVCKESDYYAMAVMLYELATGRRPFTGPVFIEKKLAGEFIPVRDLDPNLPAALDAFFKKALAPEPRDRFRSAAELAEAFPAVEPTPVRA